MTLRIPPRIDGSVLLPSCISTASQQITQHFFIPLPPHQSLCSSLPSLLPFESLDDRLPSKPFVLVHLPIDPLVPLCPDSCLPCLLHLQRLITTKSDTGSTPNTASDARPPPANPGSSSTLLLLLLAHTSSPDAAMLRYPPEPSSHCERRYADPGGHRWTRRCVGHVPKPFQVDRRACREHRSREFIFVVPSCAALEYVQVDGMLTIL
jgi:hypothetical protein